jgi:curli biogenesis system outer membrane secretion channel CsgG
MKRVSLLALVAAWFFAASVQAAPSALSSKDDQVRIAVMGMGDFHPDRAVPGNVKSLPDDLAARLIEHLSATRRFEVLERSALRRVVREQQFGKEQKETDLDRVIEAAVDDLPDTSGWTIANAAVAADHNDRLKEFKELGTTVGADYLVYAVLEQHRGSIKASAVPFSDSGKKVVKSQVDARLRLRVIDTELGRVVGADSIRTRISESIFQGREPSQDEYSMFDHLGKQAAISVLDMVFPPRIVSEDPLVINRGANENVAAGDTYRIEREGKEIEDDSGVVIGKLRSQVGEVKVTQVQATLSVVEVVKGEPEEDDLALPLTKSAAGQSGAAAASAPPLTKGPAATGNSMPRLAVGLVKAHSTATTGIDANKHIPAFTDTLISRLAQTKRFQLIDRQETDQLLNEQFAQALAENREMPSAMGQLKGADYIVIGSVSSFLIERVETKLPGSSRVFITHQGRVEGNMRIVDARSGDIMESRKVSVKQGLREPASQAQLITALADAYADQVTVNLMNTIYPIKVVAVSSGVAYINRGSDGGLSVGEQLRAVRPGEQIVDPDTGADMGTTEEELGEIVLSEVEDARSKADVGSIPLRKGDVLKRLSQNRNLRSGASAAVAVPARTGGSANKPGAEPLTLAVGKVIANPQANNIRLINANTVRVTNDLMVKLSQFQEFDIMERAEIDQVLDEKGFTAIAAGTSPVDTLRELEGADYLVHSAIDDFVVRKESTEVPYTKEIQERFFGTAEATVRMVDVHNGRVISAIKIRLNDRIKKATSSEMATNDMIDRLTTEMATRISDDLAARQKGELIPVGKKVASEPEQEKPAPKVNRPNF